MEVIMMKKESIKAMVAGMVFVSAFSFCSCLESTYTRKATVKNVIEDTVIVEDEGGNVWEFFGDGFFEGDKLTLTMDNNHTDSIITDDIIKDANKIKLDK